MLSQLVGLKSSIKTLPGLSYLMPVLKNKIVCGILGVSAALTIRKVLDIVRRKWYKLPPGSVGIPLIGAVYELGNRKLLMQCATEYGPIHLSNVGMGQTCFINDYNLLTKYFVKKELLDRRPVPVSKEPSFAGTLGETWIKRRQLFHNSLISSLNSEILSVSIGNSMDKYICPIIDDCIKNNEKWDIRKECNYLTFATLYGSVFGDNCPPPQDSTFIEYQRLTNEFFDGFLTFMMARVLLPSGSLIEQLIIPQLSLAKAFIKQLKCVENWIKYFKKTKNTSSLNNNSYYEIGEAITKDKNNLSLKNKEQLISDIAVAFSAGMHTTSTGLEQCILYLAKSGITYQNELFNEINTILENNTNNKINNTLYLLLNRNKFNKLGSFINEIIRMHGAILTTLTRDLYSNVSIELENNGNKYIIPKGSQVVGNVIAINYNKNYWENELNTSDVNKFDPKRFIDPKTNKLRKKTHLITFGYGRRNCPGQELALKELYLVTAMLIQKYIFDIPNEYESNDDFKPPLMFMDINTPKLGVKVYKREEYLQTACV